MSRTLIAVLAFAGGVASGLLLAQWYANQKISGDITGGLTKLGVSASTASSISSVLTPVIAG